MRRPYIAFVLIAVASAALYALLALRYPLAASLSTPRASWTDLATGQTNGAAGWPEFAYHAGLYLGLTVLYLLALRLLIQPPVLRVSAPARRLLVAIILLGWLVSSGILLAVAPGGESHDIYDYLFRGRMIVELGANPLSEVPAQYSRAPYYLYLAWHDHVDTYGPAWEMTSAGVAALSRLALLAGGLPVGAGVDCPASPLACRMLVGYITAYRLLAVALTGLSGWLVAALVGRNRPHLVPGALAAWLWNPLLLQSTAVGAHNDALMLALLLLMMYLLQRQRWLLGLLALVLAAHVKLTALVVAPVIGLWLLRRGGWRTLLFHGLAAAAIGVVISYLLYRPFDGWASLPRMLAERGKYLANSPWRVLYSFLEIDRDWTSEAARRLTVTLSTAFFAVGGLALSLWMLGYRPRRWLSAVIGRWRDDRLLWRATASLSLLYVLVGSFWFQHWYLTWVLAPAALLPDTRLTRTLLPWLCFGALTANVLSAFAPVLAPVTLSKAASAALLLGVIWAPMLVAGAWVSLRGPKHRATGASTDAEQEPASP